MQIRRSSFLGALAWIGCGWTHAAGHGEHAALPKSELRVERGKLCTQVGLCDHVARDGTLTVAPREAFVSVNGARSKARYSVTYRDQIIECQQPARVDGRDVALACHRAGGDGRNDVVIENGCRTGTLETEQGRYTLSFDSTNVAGIASPGREVSLRGDEGRLLAFIDYPSYDYVVYGPPPDQRELGIPVHLLAGSVGAFLHSGGTPIQCVDRR